MKSRKRLKAIRYRRNLNTVMCSLGKKIIHLKRGETLLLDKYAYDLYLVKEKMVSVAKNLYLRVYLKRKNYSYDLVFQIEIYEDSTLSVVEHSLKNFGEYLDYWSDDKLREYIRVLDENFYEVYRVAKYLFSRFYIPKKTKTSKTPIIN